MTDDPTTCKECGTHDHTNVQCTTCCEAMNVVSGEVQFVGPEETSEVVGEIKKATEIIYGPPIKVSLTIPAWPYPARNGRSEGDVAK